MKAKAASPLPSAEDVLRFLEANPDFLIDNRLAANPGGSSSSRVIALSREVTRRAHDAIRRSQTAQANMADISAVNQTSQAQVFQAACLMMAARSDTEITTFIRRQMPEILTVHASCLVVTPSSPLAKLEDVVVCTEKTLLALTEGEAVQLGKPHLAQTKALAAILPDGDVSTAMVRLPELVEGAENPMLLALIGEDGVSFAPGDGIELLAFIVTLIAVALIARGDLA
jgi:uncharacterized protein YigA (DUF484 family)